MAIRNCKRCGKTFNPFMDERICPACKEAMEAKFQEVKKYVDEHKIASMTQICEDCDVEQKQVQQWVREERLVFADNSMLKFNCEHCGAVINTGRFCDKCKKAQQNVFQNAYQKPSTGNGAPAQSGGGIRMHTFNR